MSLLIHSLLRGYQSQVETNLVYLCASKTQPLRKTKQERSLIIKEQNCIDPTTFAPREQIGPVCIMRLIFLLTLFQLGLSVRFEFQEYTHVANLFNGQPCLTGCDSNNECFINWNWEKGNCRTFEVAPIYLTSRMRDPLRKYCLSACGYFGENYEWCITTDDLKWDFCSSYKSKTFLASNYPVAQTLHGKTCTDRCFRRGDDVYYWCHFINDENKSTWEYCAPPVLPRIPVLHNSFHIGEKKKGNCDGFFKYVSTFPYCFAAADAVDDYVTDLADAIEGSTAVNSLKRVYAASALHPNSPITKYTMMKIRDLLVPVVVRAHVTNATISNNDVPKIPESVQKKLRDQMAGSTDSYDAGRLIGVQLGGPITDYNVVPRSVHWRCEEWWDMELSVKDWCKKTGGSVDMTVVVFYKDENTPIPHAFGVSLAFRNVDNSLFVDCRDKVHFNYF